VARQHVVFPDWTTTMRTLTSYHPFPVAIAASAAIAQIGLSLQPKKEKPVKGPAERDYKTDVRLNTIQGHLERERDRYVTIAMASILLISSKFVVGGLLASSFIIKTLGETITGFLGIVVLGSSLANQRFRPDMLRRISFEKLRRLRSLKRRLEDELYEATRGQVSEADIIRIRLFATRELEQIEDMEMRGLPEKESSSTS
jgi:hypothetical protein